MTAESNIVKYSTSLTPLGTEQFYHTIYYIFSLLRVYFVVRSKQQLWVKTTSIIQNSEETLKHTMWTTVTYLAEFMYSKN